MKGKYLIIRFSSIGDIVLTSPVVRCLKQQVADAEIHYVTKQQNASLVTANPFIDKVHLLAGNMGNLMAQLKNEKFDYIIDLHNNFRSRQIKFRLGVPSCTFDKLNIQKYLLVNFKINRLPHKHVVDRYMETLNYFAVKNDGKGLDFFIPEKEAFNNKSLPEEFKNGYIAFVIAGTWSTKKLPVDKVAELCGMINYPVILLGGKDEYQDGEEISRRCGSMILNMAGKLTIWQSGSLVRDASLVLTNDTGLMHIAAAYKKKILSFWGNTVPEFGMTPYGAGSSSELMEVSGLKCRPCSKLGFKKCPKGHFMCMNNQDMGKAANWIQSELTGEV